MYQYEQRIKYLESRVSELENELFMSKCSGHRQIRKESNNKEDLLLALKELKAKSKKTKKDKETIEILETVLKVKL